MRITQELLRKLAQEHVNKCRRLESDIVAAFLTGSVLTPEPILGGSTDIDIVLVHKENYFVEREVARVSNEISLDIVHQSQSFYTNHRNLRLNPWLGKALRTHASILFDTDHWLEFIQASVSSQFDRPENVYGRALPLLEKARALWFEIEEPKEEAFLEWFNSFFQAVGLAANAIAVLNGIGLTTRRFLVDFPNRAEALGNNALNETLLKIISAENTSVEQMQAWRIPWENALDAAGADPDCPINIHPNRKHYFLSAYDAMVESGTHQFALWPLMETWSQAINILWRDQSQQGAWLRFSSDLGFSPESKMNHFNALDSFLDLVEVTLDTWKNGFGL
ncbi:MAG: hypothetical protein MUO40_06010 [Anaerolineaceae bacterium]|nr:hypothetical protein [Anaerolineaceae bacterium]